ncbi:hypothetical protein HanRHA438_Chr11g0514991 [Helianthus annuus]|nr:hypothetical protein HanRHA438_Chr11g0514991 [Helianthus annuus]
MRRSLDPFDVQILLCLSFPPSDRRTRRPVRSTGCSLLAFFLILIGKCMFLLEHCMCGMV